MRTGLEGERGVPSLDRYRREGERARLSGVALHFRSFMIFASLSTSLLQCILEASQSACHLIHIFTIPTADERRHG